MRLFCFAVICAAFPVAGAAQGFEAENDLIVFPLGASSFEVIEANGEGARGIWCAAASYAQERLGVAGGKRMYVKTPRGPSVSVPGRTGVVFTLNASDLASPPFKSYSVSVRKQSLNLGVGQAHEFCPIHDLPMSHR